MTEPRRRPSATVRFYTGFFIVLAVALGIVFALGFRAGGGRPRAAAAHDDVAAYRQCLRLAKSTARTASVPTSITPVAYEKFVRLLVAAQTCARQSGLPYLAQGDVSDVTGVTVTGDRYDPADPIWRHPSAGNASAPSGISRP